MRCQCRPSVQRSSTAVRVREHVNAPVGVRRSGELLIQSHFLSFPLISYRLRGRWGMRPNLHPRLLPGGEGTCRGVSPGPIWPCLASFTPTVEARNEATLASFGTPLTPTHRASMRPRWPRLASSGVRRSGVTFNSVAFSCIWLHSLTSTRVVGRDCEVPALAGTRMRTTYVTNVATGGAMA